MEHVYDAELDRIRRRLVLMGEKALEQVRLTTLALETQDAEKIPLVLKADDEIDRLEKEIDAACVRYLSLRSPVGVDVRLLTLAMKACHDLERVGDEAVSIAKRTQRILNDGPVRDLHCIPEMAQRALAQLRTALDSFHCESSAKAISVPKADRAIDDFNRDNYDHFAERATLGDAAFIKKNVELIFISKSLERVGDHAANIAEEVFYLLEGSDVRHTEAVKRSI